MNPLILIVDDEPVGREALESLLLTQGYRLDFATHGLEALQKAQALSPDVILLDVMMPGMDGYEVCRRLRADPDLAEVPVVMVTALDDRDSRLQGLEAGADDFVTKPIDRSELRARLRTITRLNRYRRLKDEQIKLERQVQRLNALRVIDIAISGSLDLGVTLRVLLDQVVTQLKVAAAAVLLLNPHTHLLEYAAGYGFQSRVIERTRLRLGEGYAGRAALERRLMSVPDLAASAVGLTRTELARVENIQAYFGVPLLSKGAVKGILEVFHRAPLEADQDWLQFLETLGGQAAIAVDSAELFEGLQRSNIQLILAYDATIEGWSRALDLRDKETEGHSKRVTEMTLRLAQAVNVSEAELVQLRRGALLHDIGKMGIPDRILLKPGPLTDEEWVIMRQHPQLAFDLLSPIQFLRAALDIPYCHHEKWDGSGYPRGLKGEQIPLAARLFALADVWDALRSDRPYRAGWAPDKVLAHIQAGSGTHFDPRAVDVFLALSH